MASTTSLLRSARSTRQKVLAYEDQLEAFEWEGSAKTADDYAKYARHLDQRIASTTDASKVLTYQSKLRTVGRSYVSHEIQRQTIDVLEGSSNLQTKYNVMVELYKAAADNEDLDLAQSLRLQLDNLDRSIQAEQVRGQSLAATMASRSAATIEDAIESIKTGRGTYTVTDTAGNSFELPTLPELQQLYKDGGEEGIMQVAEAARAYRPDGGLVNYWDLATGALDSITQMYQVAADTVGVDTSKGRGYLKKAQDIQTGEATFDIAPGLTKITYADLQKAQEAARAGQQYFVPSQKDGENTFVKSSVVDYMWGRDAQGNYKLIDVRSELSDVAAGQKLKIQDKDGQVKEVDLEEAKKILAERGIKLTSEDGMLRIYDPSGAFGMPGVSPGTSFTAVIGSDGQLRARTTEGQIVSFAVDTNGNVVASRVNQDVSIFGDPRLGQYGAETVQGIEVTKQLLGQNQVKPADVTLPNELRVASVQDINDPSRIFAGLDTTELLARGRAITQLQATDLGSSSISMGLIEASPYASAELQKRINTATEKIQQAYAAPILQQPAPTQQYIQSAIVQQPLQSPVMSDINQTPVPSNSRIPIAPTAQQQSFGKTSVVKPSQRISGVSVARPAYSGLRVQ